MRCKPKRKAPKNCTWHEEAQCVMARLSRNSKKYQKNFTLSEYGTWKKAETAAVIWLKKARKRLGKPKSNEGRITARNTSGFPGIWATGGDKKSYACWRARWPRCEKKGGISFSVDSMGDKMAFLSAWIAKQNRTVDRGWIAKRLKRFVKTKKANKLLDQRLVMFE